MVDSIFIDSIKNLTENSKAKERGDQELLSHEKRPEELITSIEGYVSSVVNYNHQNVHIGSNGIIGPGGRSYKTRTGDTSRLEIALADSSPTNSLIFHGTSGIRGGDKIRAYVVKGEIKKLNYSRYSESSSPFMDRPIKGEDEVLVNGELK